MPNEVIIVRDLEKSFNKSKILKKISFNVKEGSITGFLGPNGAGKTTTIKLILGFLNPDNGLIEIFGKSGKRDEIMKKIGYVSETPNFYPYLKGREILELTGKLLKMDSDYLEKEIGNLSKFFQFEKFLLKKISTYSFGTMKKLAFIQSILGGPELLIIDEPYIGLDPVAINRVREIILEFKREGKTIFLSSHLLSEMERICDDIVLINNGEIVYEGELLKLKEMNRAISKGKFSDLESIFLKMV